MTTTIGLLDIRFCWVIIIWSLWIVLRQKQSRWNPFWIALLLLHLWPLAPFFPQISPLILKKVEAALFGGILGSIGVLLWKHRAKKKPEVQPALARIQGRVFNKVPLLGALIAFYLWSNWGHGALFIFLMAGSIGLAFTLVEKNKVFWHYLFFVLLMGSSFGFYYASSIYKLMILNTLWIFSMFCLLQVVNILESEGHAD
jgi:hypothetical protein